MSEKTEYSYQDITDFSQELDGIEYSVIVSNEGFPLAYNGLSAEKAEAAAALAIDLLYGSSEAAKDLLGRLGHEVIVDVGDGTVVDVKKVRNLLLLYKGRREPVTEAMKTTSKYLNGIRINCPYCGEDLTLEKSKCSKCGKIIPFASDRCPFCGEEVFIKPCPRCGKITTSKGNKVTLSKDPSDVKFAVLEGIIVGAVAGGYTLMITNNPIIGILAGLIGAGVTGGVLFNKARTKYRIIE